jgi:hypothetical protein
MAQYIPYTFTTVPHDRTKGPSGISFDRGLSFETMIGAGTFEMGQLNAMYVTYNTLIIVDGLPLVEYRRQKRLWILQGSENPAQQLHRLLEHHCSRIIFEGRIIEGRNERERE